MITSIKIELEKSDRLYHIGQVVVGKLVIICDKPTRTKEVSLVVHGGATVKWWTCKHDLYGNKFSWARKWKIEFSAKEGYVHCKRVLAGDGRNFTELPAGTTVYPFRFYLKSSLPFSFNSDMGKVSYLIRGKVKRSVLERDEVASVAFAVNGGVDLNLYQHMCLPRMCKESKGSNLFANRTGEISFTFRLPDRSGYIPGEAANFDAEISNSSNQRVREVQVALKQLITYRAQGNSRVATKTLKVATGPGLLPGTTTTWSSNISVPNVSPTGPGKKCTIIEIRYYLCMEVVISGVSGSLQGRLPVLIGNFPLRRPAPVIQQSSASTPTTSPSAPLPPTPIPTSDIALDLPPSYAEAVASPNVKDGLPEIESDEEWQDDSDSEMSHSPSPPPYSDVLSS